MISIASASCKHWCNNTVKTLLVRRPTLNTHVWKQIPRNVTRSLHAPPSGRQTKLPFPSVWLFGSGCVVFGAAKCALSPAAHCRVGGGHKTRVYDEPRNNNVKFDWKTFFHYLKPDWLLLLIAVFSALAVAFVNIKIPVCLGDVVNVLSHFTRSAGDEAADHADRVAQFFAEIREPALKLVGIYVMQSALTTIYISTLAHAGERFATRLRQAMMDAILRQDITFFDKTKTGEIMSSLSGDVQDFKSAFKLCISQGIRSVAQTVGCVMSLYYISPEMTTRMLTVLPVIIAAGTVFGSLLRSLSRAAQEQTAKAVGIADEAIGNIRTVRAFAMEDSEAKFFETETKKAEQLHASLGVGIGCFQGVTNLAINGIVLGVLYMGGNMMEANQLSPGKLMSFLVATQMIQRSLAQLFMLFGHYIRGITSGARVLEYINMKDNITITGGIQLPLETLRGDIVFKNVSFAYPSRPKQYVLEDFSLQLPAGKVVAICGPSGSGKSTVAALLERFYDLKEGSITIDGHNLSELDPTWLRGKVIGFISQEPVLFATSIMENIRYGRPDATDEDVYEAARQAHAHEFITSFSKKYDTVLGERGVTISGGQKQRIAIARALLKNPHILILDEATSALDAESEKVVQATLDEVVKGRTVLVIAHRLSTIRNADIIAVLLDGNIVEIGDHNSLTRQKGMYWKLTHHHEHVRPSG
ncbi:mitochondrial potassium channel ATP-binding subunit-like [Ornithodoros turicata]|uniref:mitochondrial potassium channel ATP-binding subunit-like n=1 Tax=Ornithodoros turicata TaxID=34597 RepID=UPI003139C093